MILLPIIVELISMTKTNHDPHIGMSSCLLCGKPIYRCNQCKAEHYNSEHLNKNESDTNQQPNRD